MAYGFVEEEELTSQEGGNETVARKNEVGTACPLGGEG